MGEFGTAKWTDYSWDGDKLVNIIVEGEVQANANVDVGYLDITMEDVKNGFIDDEKMKHLKQVVWNEIENGFGVWMDYECGLVEYFGGDLYDR